jgi:uncharacterized RDD family membrane protein YckC
MIYAGFWRRLGALLLDFVITLPITALVLSTAGLYRLFYLYYFVPGILFSLFYSVYLVRRFGGTPGKLLAGLQIRKVDGTEIGYREALLRYLPEAVLNCLLQIALISSVIAMTDSEYISLGFLDRAQRMVELAPAWRGPVNVLNQIWIWSEFVVMLTNRKRRALHDFIAGTVVIRRGVSALAQDVSAASAIGTTGLSP